MKEFTNLRDETILINPSHILMVEKTSDGSKITFDSKISAPGEYEQKNCLYVKERFEYVTHLLSDEPFWNPDIRVPKRFD